MQGAWSAAAVGTADVQHVIARGSDIDAVFQPFASAGEADVIAAAAVSVSFGINTLGSTCRGTVDRPVEIVVGDAFSTIVKPFRLNRARNSKGRSKVGR